MHNYILKLNLIIFNHTLSLLLFLSWSATVPNSNLPDSYWFYVKFIITIFVRIILGQQIALNTMYCKKVCNILKIGKQYEIVLKMYA